MRSDTEKLERGQKLAESPRQGARWWAWSVVLLLFALVVVLGLLFYPAGEETTQRTVPAEVLPPPPTPQERDERPTPSQTGDDESQAAAQSAPAEPAAPALRPVVREDFEGVDTGAYALADAQAGWGGMEFARDGFDDRDAEIVENPDGDGRVLAVEIPEDTYGQALYFDLRFPDADEAVLRYRMRFGEDFQFSKPGGKLPGLGGTAPGAERPPLHCDDPGADDGFSARHMWFKGGTMAQYLYFAAKDSDCGDNTELFDDDEFLEDERWYHVEQRVVMNDPGSDNGVITTWIDGELAAETDGLSLRKTDSYGVNTLVFSSYFGGNDDDWAHDRDEVIYYDDFEVLIP